MKQLRRFLAFWGISIIALTWFFRLDVASWWQTRDWRETVGIVTGVSTQPCNLRHGSGVRVFVYYKFDVGGQQYAGRRESTVGNACISRSAAKTQEALFPIDAPISLVYNPVNPNDNARTRYSFFSAMVVPLLYVAVTGSLIVFGQARIRYRRAQCNQH